MNKSLRALVVFGVAVALCSGAVFGQAATENSPHRFNIDFGAWRPAESRQTGPAAAGEQGDFWNTVGVAWNHDHTESDLNSATGNASPIRVRMVNLGGGWGSSGKMGVKDPMLDNFNYPANNRGGDSEVTLLDVPAGTYNLYLYGHGTGPLYYGDYTVTAGDENYGRKATAKTQKAITANRWVEGYQYVRFSGVKVKAGETIHIRIQPGGVVTDHWGRTFSDAMICGLQLIPAAGSTNAPATAVEPVKNPSDKDDDVVGHDDPVTKGQNKPAPAKPPIVEEDIF